ncbi:MAG: hypothetical protein EBY32_20770 [Proteobacteria bacterium]|nr:hypothetical protein [Pseudomonadota bacterium]
MSPSIGVHLDDSRKKIRLFGNDVAILPNACDVARHLHVFEKLKKLSLPGWGQIKRRRDPCGIEWALCNLTENREA